MIPEIEKENPESIKALQEKKLTEVIAYVKANSAFYQDHFKKNGIDPDSIKSYDDLAKVPPIGKKELQGRNKDFYCVDRKDIMDFCNTSGTEGEAVTIPLTEGDIERLAYNEALSLASCNISENDVFQLTTTVDRRFMAGLAYVLGARRLGAGMVRVGPRFPELQWKTIKEIEPTVLIAVPSFVLKLIEYARINNIDYQNSSVRKIVCIGEPIRDVDFGYNALGKRITDQWDIPLYSTYASSEMSTAFTECDEACGGHEHPELIITEVLDDEGNQVSEGEAGELTITTLGVEAMPLIRFRTGDVLRKYTTDCQCGRKTSRLGPVEGRKNQMIKFKGTTVYPPAIFDVMDKIPDVEGYVVKVLKNEVDMEEIQVLYYSEKQINQVSLANHFKSAIRVTPKLIPTPMGELKHLLFPEMSRKPVKFYDER